MKVNSIQNTSDLKLFFDTVKQKNDRLYLFCLIAYENAARCSDVLNLTCSDVLSGQIYKADKKVGKKHTYTFSQDCINLTSRIMKQHNLDNNDLIFKNLHTNKDKAISRQYIWQELKKIAKDAAIDVNIGTHTFRKSHAFHYIQQATDKFEALAELQQTFKHSNFVTTLIYSGQMDRNIQNNKKQLLTLIK